MFSNFLLILFQKLQFVGVVIWRFLIIVFRKRKDIKLLYIDYNTKNLFDNSFFIINYRFRNALYYQFGEHKTLEKQIKILNLKNIDHEFNLIVYGFFQKKIYPIKLKPQMSFDSLSFKTSISKLNLEATKQRIVSQPSKVYVNQTEIKIKDSKIKFNPTTYNQNEFI